MLVSALCRPPALPGPRHQRCLKQIWLDHIHQRVHFLSNRRRQRLDPGRPAAIDIDEGSHESPILLIEPAIIDAFQLQRGLGDRQVDLSGSFHRRKIAHSSQQTIGDSRRAARATRQFPQRIVFAL